MHPLLEQICRARFDNIQESAFKRWQQELRNEIQPKLDRLDVLEAEAAKPRKGKAVEVPA